MKKQVLKLVLIAFFLSFKVFAVRIEKKEHFIFIGNPGVGKSSIINGLANKKVTESGVAFGTGMTDDVQEYVDPEGRVFLDTPGLADVSKRQLAAQKIEEALKKDGIYRIFVVLTMENGRARPEDIATIESVLDAVDVPMEDKKYSVIINQVSVKVAKAIKTTPGAFKKLQASLNGGKYEAKDFFVINFDRDIDDGNREFVNITDEFRDFLFNKTPTMNIAKEQVGTVDCASFDALKRSIEEASKKMEKMTQEHNEKMERLRDSFNSGSTNIREGDVTVICTIS